MVAGRFGRWRSTHVVQPAAQASVRYSLEHSFAHADSNFAGTASVLEGGRRVVPHLQHRRSHAGRARGLPTTLEHCPGQTVIQEYVTMQPYDLVAIFAAVEDLQAAVGFAPRTPLEDGLRSFVDRFNA